MLLQTSCIETSDVLNQVSAASVVQQNAAALFDCEAPELFCGLPHFTGLLTDSCLIFNIYFKVCFLFLWLPGPETESCSVPSVCVGGQTGRPGPPELC